MAWAEVVVDATEGEETTQRLRLSAFTAAALALPGMAGATGIDLTPEALALDSRYSNYQESHGRMSIQTFQNAGGV